MKLIAIKTNEGFLISDNVKNDSYFSSKIRDLLFDGVNATNTHKSDWFKINQKLINLEKKVPQQTINRRFELKAEYDGDKFKKSYLQSDVYDEEGDMFDWFSDIKGLYNYKEDIQESKFESVDFEWEEILEIDIYKNPTGFTYKASAKYSSDSYTVTQQSLEYDILSQVIVPNVLLHTQPCKLSSKETYDIIRKHIKENINPKIAEITSDYEFCFNVKKKIPLAKPYEYQVDVNNSIFSSKKKKPKLETRMVGSESRQVFEMTHSQAGNNGKGYEKYTLIKPFEAENQEAMKEYIDTYLETLINAINEPVKQCDCCNGVGVLFNKI